MQIGLVIRAIERVLLGLSVFSEVVLYSGSAASKLQSLHPPLSQYIAMSITAKQGQWLAQIFRDMGYGKYIAPNLMKLQTRSDNQEALALIKNGHLNDRSKHIAVTMHHIRDLYDNGRIDPMYVPTADMIADGFTKPLPRVSFERFVRKLGLGMFDPEAYYCCTLWPDDASVVR